MNALLAKVLIRLRDRTSIFSLGRVRKLYWRALGLRSGKDTMLPRIYVTWPHQVSFGAGCVLEHDSYFKFDGNYRPGPCIVFGDEVFIGVGCEFNIRAGIRIGPNCLIASGCYFVDHDHGFGRRDIPMKRQRDGVERPIEIAADVWIGAHAIVLKGVTIGQGAIVAAGSVVNQSIGAFEIWGGVPARKLRDRPPGGSPGSKSQAP